MRRRLRRIGQYLGLIYQDDGTWNFGNVRRNSPAIPARTRRKSAGGGQERPAGDYGSDETRE